MSTKVFVIAEAGHNFNGNVKTAKLMIEEAKLCKADAIKFQLYDTDKIKRPWQSRYFELKFSEIGKEDAKELKEHCDKVGIEFLSSAFDVERVGWLEELGVKRHKIASRSIRDHEMIDAMVMTGKPIIASLGDWHESTQPMIPADFLYCVAEYPATIKRCDFPLNFGEGFFYQGFSDHTIGMEWAKEAVRRGATIIEKHFTLNKTIPGCDQVGSCEPWELKDFVQFVRQFERQS